VTQWFSTHRRASGDKVSSYVQIIAEYEEQGGPSAPQGGDGTSGSSIGSTSPDVFHNRKPLNNIPAKTAASVANQSRSSPAIPYQSLPSRDRPNHYAQSDTDRQPSSFTADRQYHAERQALPDRERQAPPHMERQVPPHMDRQTRDRPPTLSNNHHMDSQYAVEVTEQDLTTGKS